VKYGAAVRYFAIRPIFGNEIQSDGQGNYTEKQQQLFGLVERGYVKAHRQRSLVGAFAKQREATVSFVMSLSACQSVRVEQLGSLWTNFHKISYLKIFRKSVEKVQLKSNKNNWYFT